MPFAEALASGPDLDLGEGSGRHHQAAGRLACLLVVAVLVTVCGDSKGPTEPRAGWRFEPQPTGL